MVEIVDVPVVMMGQLSRRKKAPGHRRDEEYGCARVFRAWDARQARGGEHRFRDAVHVQTERKGASDRSRASGAGVGYSTDHTQTTDKKINDGLVTTQSEDFST